MANLRRSDPDHFKYKKEVQYAYTYSSGSNYLGSNTLTYPTGSRALRPHSLVGR